ncbi:MAG: thioredoxin domain-containing protein [Acidimicrobiaceae bacterium]|nr:thioredoxin domain-containing protein [Acidimicrobiaceae bacterium]
MPLLRDVPDLSAYLAAHRTNPVRWWTWGEDAFAEAARRDVPVLVSVGYAACHWCHVMAHESFEDPGVAELVNDHFVAIKVDREERPDVDALYMAATQLLSGHGGWPMTVFTRPDGQPFVAGTYYPPRDRGGLVGFPTLLRAVRDAWRERRDVVDDQVARLREALTREVRFLDHLSPVEAGSLDLPAALTHLTDELTRSTDEDGGEGAPRFPRPSYVEALWRDGRPESRETARRILRAMSRRGLFDHLDGGFARYSVDQVWHVPHFEKMLSDQALLARLYWRVGADPEADPEWRLVAERTADFVERRLRRGDLYCSSLDADADGVEGSHVTWTPREVTDALDDQPEEVRQRVLARYCLRSPGDLEGRSVPRLESHEPWDEPRDLTVALRRLREVREGRPAPSRDEKVILEWNAMWASALFASRDPDHESRAREMLDDLARVCWSDGTWWRTDARRHLATAADLAWYLDALLDALESDGDDRWLVRAREIAETLLGDYWEDNTVRYSAPGAGLFLAPQEVFDGATPSAHAVALRALARLGLVDDPAYSEYARRLLERVSPVLISHPRAVVDSLEAAAWVDDALEVVIPGARGELARHVRSMPMLSAVLITGHGSSPVLEGRLPGRAYVCRQRVCHSPVDSLEDLARALEEA